MQTLEGIMMLPAKLKRRSLHPHNLGKLTKQQADQKGFLFVSSHLKMEQKIYLTAFVDSSEAIFIDAKFMAFGPPDLVAIIDIACDVLIDKRYDQVGRIGFEILEKQATPVKPLPSFSKRWINTALDLFEDLTMQCSSVPLPEVIESPVNEFGEKTAMSGSMWEALTQEQKIQLIEKVIEEQIQPYIALDAGGISLLSLEKNCVEIAYQGACTSCPSSIGSTMNAILGVLRQQVFEGLEVKIADFNLSF